MEGIQQYMKCMWLKSSNGTLFQFKIEFLLAIDCEHIVCDGMRVGRIRAIYIY